MSQHALALVFGLDSRFPAIQSEEANMAQTVSVEASSEEVLAAVWSALSRHGYHPICSFDLQEAIAHHAKGCGCPYHGTAMRTVQYIVLLAYPPDTLPSPPRVLTIHSYEQTTWISLQPDRNIGAREARMLLSALAEAASWPEPQDQTVGSRNGLAVSMINE